MWAGYAYFGVVWWVLLVGWWRYCESAYLYLYSHLNLLLAHWRLHLNVYLTVKKHFLHPSACMQCVASLHRFHSQSQKLFVLSIHASHLNPFSNVLTTCFFQHIHYLQCLSSMPSQPSLLFLSFLVFPSPDLRVSSSHI